ncbi:MAG: CBS domain-containing protein [Gemmatimonadota bacterium]
MLIENLITRSAATVGQNDTVDNAAQIMKDRDVGSVVNVDVEQCLERMETHGVRRIPIVDDEDELIGVVSLDDILIHLGRVLGTASALVRAEVAGVV